MPTNQQQTLSIITYAVLGYLNLDVHQMLEAFKAVGLRLTRFRIGAHTYFLFSFGTRVQIATRNRQLQ